MINLSDYYKSADGSNLIFNNGNSNGADIVIGTNDNYNLALEANGVKKLILTQDSLSGNISKTSFGAGSATGLNSFAIGLGKAFGAYSHAEGFSTAFGDYSHAEGFSTAFGAYSHAEGGSTAFGDYSHAEGYLTASGGIYSHAEGIGTAAIGDISHSEGSGTVASGNYSHAQGIGTATGRRNAFLSYTSSTRVFTFSPSVSGNFSYVTGGTRLSVDYPFSVTIIVASRDSSTGSISATTDEFGFDFTDGTIIDNSGTAGHAEGAGTTASGFYSHAEGQGSTASGAYSHAEGNSTTASGRASHAAGSYAEAAYDRSWIWKGSTATNIISTTRTDQFMVSAAGGVYIPGNVGIGTAANDQALTVVGNISASATGYFSHVAAATKSFYIPHPTKPGMHLQYGSLESPYHGIRLTGNGSVKSGDSVVIQLPDYVFSLVHQEGVNIQLTNYQHNKTLFVDDIDVSNNTFTVKCEKKLFDKGEYKFFWSFTATRKDIPKLETEI